MSRLSRIQLLAAALTILALAPATAQNVARIEAAIAEWAKADTPGCSVAVDRNGAATFRGGYGLTDLERQVPITPASRFDIGSVSKQFTAAALILLAEEGKFSLPDIEEVHQMRRCLACPAAPGRRPIWMASVHAFRTGLRGLI